MDLIILIIFRLIFGMFCPEEKPTPKVTETEMGAAYFFSTAGIENSKTNTEEINSEWDDGPRW